jgi:hypothetical protein
MTRNKSENDNPSPIEDLPVDEARQDEVKGGNLSSVAAYSIVIDRRPAL